jgi:GNAT superfamily N-acetyltransferase
MEQKTLREIEKFANASLLKIFFTGSKKVSGATLFWSDKIVDYFWSYASLINTKEPEELIKEVIDFYKLKHRKPTVYVTPWTKPANLKEILQKQGFKLAYTDVWMVLQSINIDVELPSNFEIKEVTTKKDMQTFVEIFHKAYGGATPEEPYGALPKEYGESFLASFGNKPWAHFIGYFNGKPAATASLALGNKFAGIYSIGTVPEFRKKGLGAAITKFLAKLALDKNCKVFLATEKGSYNEKFYNKLGFKTEFTGEGFVLE